MHSLPSQPIWLRRLTLGYLALWVAALVVGRIELLPEWSVGLVLAISLPLGVYWIMRLRQANAEPLVWSIVGSVFFIALWQLSVVGSEVLGLAEFTSSFAQTGLLGFFLIGLAWVIWFLEKASRRIELDRIDRAMQGGTLPTHLDENDVLVSQPIWSPLDPQAWYYGREGRKLKQSTLAFFTYGTLFWLASLLLSQVGGCQEEYELPAGGGKQKTVSQQVRIQKVIRKKYVVNPYSSISFKVPPIDEVKLQLQEVTAHQYTIGYGEGTGAGFGGGTSKGKVRLIRLEYDGGDWDLNFGIGGDNNMLLEYGVLTQQKTADQSESIRISQLANFPKEKAPPLVFLTGQKSLTVANNEVKTLREYLLDKHGMLFASSGSGNFHNQLMSLMSRVLPEIKPVAVPLDDTIHRVPFAMPTLPYVVPHGGREALGWTIDGRLVAYYHPGDISDAWADGHAGVSSDIYNSCYQLGANVINYGHVEYSKWLQSKGNGK